jgi:hypothetical protein
MRKVFLFAALLVSGCSSVIPPVEEEPVGIGRGTDDYKRSPCACLEIRQAPADAEWLRRLGTWSETAA